MLWATGVAGGYALTAARVAVIAAGSLVGAAVLLRRGGNAVARVLARSDAARASESSAEVEAQQDAAEFWERTATSVGSAVEVLQESHTLLANSHREAAARAAAQDQDFRRLASAWLDHYRCSIDEISDNVKALLAGIQRGQLPARPSFPALPERQSGRFEELNRDLGLLRHQVMDAVIQAGAATTGAAEAELVVFAGIGQRLRIRADRVLEELDRLEGSTEDPDSLLPLLRVDHRIVLIRRDVEAVQVLAGGQLRQSGGPADVSTILRQATAEIEEYGRVKIGQVAPVQVVAYARSGLIHILAALLENATRFSRDEVTLTSSLDSTGLVVTVTDHGLHMSGEDLRTLNALLADPDPAMVRARLMEGRIGLLVTAKLARQYQLTISLGPADHRGTRAVVVIPSKLLTYPTDEPKTDHAPADRQRPSPAPPLASVSLLVPAQTGRSLPHRITSTPARGSSGQRDGEHRPGLPRRHRAPQVADTSREPERPAADTADATPGLIGAYLLGTQQADDGPASS